MNIARTLPLETVPADQLESTTGGAGAADAARRTIVLIKGPSSAKPTRLVGAGLENVEHALNHNWKARDIIEAVQGQISAQRAHVLDHARRYLNAVEEHLKLELGNTPH